MNEYTNSLARVPKACLAKCASFLELKNISDNTEALFWASRDGLLDMRKLKHFLSNAAVVSFGVA